MLALITDSVKLENKIQIFKARKKLKIFLYFTNLESESLINGMICQKSKALLAKSTNIDVKVVLILTLPPIGWLINGSAM